MTLLLTAPLGAAVWILLCRHPRWREAGVLIAAAAMTAGAVDVAARVLADEVVEATLMTLVPGSPLALRADALGAIFALVASSLWILTTIFAGGYFRGTRSHSETRFHLCFAICLGSVAGLAMAANLVTFYLFFELLTLSTWPLVTHDESDDAFAAGRRYLAYTLGGGVLLLAGIVAVDHLTGSTGFTPGGLLAGSSASPQTLWIVSGLLLVGVGVKAAIMPLHSWLPAAMVAPTPVSALLHAVAVVKAGVFGVLRVVGWVIGPNVLMELGVADVLAIAAAATILVASLIALTQDSLKKRLAFSTVSQLSYIVLGAALCSPAAILGASLHIANHAFMKITLFFCAGAIYVHTKRTRVSQLDGLGREMPWTFAAFSVAALGLAGFPPIAGWTSKWNLMVGAVEAGRPAFVPVLIASAVLNVIYLVSIPVRAFFRTGDPGPGTDAPISLRGPLVATASVAVLIGVAPSCPPGLLELANQVVVDLGSSLQGGAR